MTDEETTGTATTRPDPEWFAEAMDLHGQGLDADAIAEATGKAVSTVRRLIKRKAAEAEGGAAADPGPPAEPDGEPDPGDETDDAAAAAQAELDANPARVDAATAERLAASAGDSGGDPDPDPQQLFPDGSIDGDGVSFKTLIKPNMTVTHSVHLTGHEVPIPNGTGLLDPNKEGMLLVTYEVSDAGKPVPIREGERGAKRITGYHIKQKVRPVHLERVVGEEGVIEGHFAALLEAAPSRAGALLDRLIVRAGRSLQ